MAEKIFETFNTEGKVVIEAPTGLGKSFAYLVPAIIYSVKSDEKVYVSTKTKTLQDQLFFKDLQFLEKNL
jgi:ATP-dependent DNA helicase DinG